MSWITDNAPLPSRRISQIQYHWQAFLNKIVLCDEDSYKKMLKKKFHFIIDIYWFNEEDQIIFTSFWEGGGRQPITRKLVKEAF